jgi:hypothetical protein
MIGTDAVRVFGLRDAVAQPWRNGGGLTRELLCGPLNALSPIFLECSDTSPCCKEKAWT